MPLREKRTDPEAALADAVAEYYADPFGFVLFAFNWGAGDLEGFDGPDDWQREYLIEVGRQVALRRFDGVAAVDPIRAATASGHGIGKSALTAWLILWLMSTRPHCKGVVTANTSAQLESKTWAELAKWTKRCITGHWFKVTTGKGALKIVHEGHPETWRCDAQTCREENSEAFAGLHAAGSTPFYIFDEASAVPDTIWDVAEGGMTDGEPHWYVFGNPTRNSGRFRECFGRFKHRWMTRQIDSRTVKITNKQKIQEWVDDYGEDSDFVRVRVKGVFPRAGSMQFIAGDLADQAMRREPHATTMDPLILGVDVARFGDDEAILFPRRGRDACTLPMIAFRNLDTMQLAARIAEWCDRHKPDAVFVDEGGVGGGVVDRLRYLKYPVVGVQFGGVPDRSGPGDDAALTYADKAAEMWGNMRDWLKGGALPDDPDLEQQLTGREYGYVIKDGKDAIKLEKKSDMKKRGLSSPDRADGLCLTFAYPVAPTDHTALLKRGAMHQAEYNPLSRDHIRA